MPSLTTGSLASVEPGTGKVRAVAVSRDFTTRRHTMKGQLNFNTAVDHAHGGGSGAQFGSNAKAFILAAALEEGIPLGHRIDAPGTLSDVGPFTRCDGSSAGMYPPFATPPARASTVRST